MSIYRNNSYIDIELLNFDKKSNKYYWKLPRHTQIYNKEYFNTFKIGILNGVEFIIPNHASELVEKIYGKNWRTPQNIHGHKVNAG